MAALSYSKSVALDGANRSARARYTVAENLDGIEGGARTAPSAMTTPASPVAMAAAHSPPAGYPNASAKVQDDVPATLRSRADAWSSRDVKAYQGRFMRSFVPADGRSKESWTILRRKRNSGPRFIDITIAQPQVTRTGDNRASVIFERSYRSDSYAGQVSKRMDMGRRGEWKILSEVTVN